MKYCIDISGTIQFSRHAARTMVIGLSVERRDSGPLCLGLMMLNHGLVDALTLRARTSGERLAVKATTSLDAGEWSASRQEVQLSADTLGYILVFLLELYRDGTAPVDHLDVYLQPRDSTVELLLLVKADAAKPPMSGDEARRILGVD